MRYVLATLAASLTLHTADSAAASSRATSPGPQRSLSGALNRQMRAAGSHSGAYVLDLTAGRQLYSARASTTRLPASVAKLFTTYTALRRFGPSGTLSTQVLGVGVQQGANFTGTLYLRGGGDPTFGSAGFDRATYGAGATVQRLVAGLAAQTGIRSVAGHVVADETMLDSRRGTPATGYLPSIFVEGELSALAYNRGWADNSGTVYFEHPALEAGRQFVAALRAARIKVPRRLSVTIGQAPSGARPLSSVQSPSMATLISLTNTPSDNFFAEMLLKDLGARYGAGGTTSAGAAVVRTQVAQSFGIHPRLVDGSGLSRTDRTSPLEVGRLLSRLAGNRPFTDSLAVAGETGTLRHEMQGTYAQGRCRGKTGTLSNVSNVVGYCRARDGHTLAYAIMMNQIDPNYAHSIQAQMQIALARYDG